MALTPALTWTAVSSDGTQSTLTDSTVYGSPNPNRNQVAVFLTGYKMDENQVGTALTITSFDPETVTNFTVANDIDGWYQYLFVIVNNYNSGTSYTKYNLVWDTVSNAFYQYINNTPGAGHAVTDVNYFTVVTDPTTKIANVGTSSDPGNLIYQVVNKVIRYQSSICFLKAASKHAKETCGTGDCGCDSRLGKLFHKIRDLYTNMGFNESQGLFIDGERNARLVEKYCDDCGCLTR